LRGDSNAKKVYTRTRKSGKGVEAEQESTIYSSGRVAGEVPKGGPILERDHRGLPQSRLKKVKKVQSGGCIFIGRIPGGQPPKE